MNWAVAGLILLWQAGLTLLILSWYYSDLPPFKREGNNEDQGPESQG